MGGLGHGWRTRRPGLMFLALAALWLQAMIPAGYMVAPDQSVGLVICTGHGPLTNPGHPGDAPASRHDGTCVFAGHGLAVAPPPVAPVAAEAVFAHTPVVARLLEQSPGRGLAAPPPPSHAPPQLI